MSFMKRGHTSGPTDIRIPIGIRPWQRELRRFARQAKEGFVFEQLDNSSDSYRLSAMVSCEKVADLMLSFAERCLEEEAFLILEYYPEEWSRGKEDSPTPAVFYSPYMPTGELLQAIGPYLERMIQDGFVGFGMANNRLGMELFYSEEKVLTCFTGSHLKVMDLFSRYGIQHCKELLFPTDFGHDHLSLQCHPGQDLPSDLTQFSDRELDYVVFCGELTEQLEMYPVEESLSFFLSRKDQDAIEQRLLKHPDYSELADEDFGALLLDWNDFVEECTNQFDGDLTDYQQGLLLRDMLQYVIEGVPSRLKTKLDTILKEPDQQFGKLLGDHRKRLDAPQQPKLSSDRFWYRGVVRNQGSSLRRDLIRQGWFNPS